MLDSRIYTFITVCKYMNFTRASRELCITQPTVTQHIQHLETQYATKLFTYSNRKLDLTNAGEELLRAALAMASDEVLLREKIYGMTGRRETLRFGATLTIGEFVFSETVSRLVKAHPELNIHMMVENTNVLLEMMDQGEIEFAAVEGFFPKVDYDYVVFDRVPFIAVGHPDFQPEGGVARMDDLLDTHLLLREEGSGSRNIFESWLMGHNYALKDFKHFTIVNNMTVMKKLLLAGVGIGFMYRSVVEDELASGQLVEIEVDGFDIEHEFTFVWRKGSIYQEEYKAFFKELQ